EVDAEWRRFSAMVIVGEKRASLLSPDRVKRPASIIGRIRQHWVPYAVGAFAAVLLSVFFPQIWTPAAQPTAQYYTTQRAERLTTTLPDGTQVILGPATTLQYAESGTGERTVVLQGQAYFTVTPD